MIGEQPHQRRVAVLGRDVERRGADVAEKMAPEPHVGRIARGAAFLAERRLLPLDPDVRVRAAFEQLLRELQRRHLAGLHRRALRRIADAGRAVGARLAQPGDRVERRAARIRQVGVGAAIEQHRGQLVVGVDDGHAERARPVGRDVVHVGAARQQQRGGVEARVADGEEQRREAAGGLGREFAPASSSTAAASVLPSDAAHISAVCPRYGSTASTLAPRVQQQPHGVGAPGQRRRHQHRLAFVGGGVGVGARRDQALHDRRVAVERREVERRDVVAGGGLRAGAGAQELLDERAGRCAAPPSAAPWSRRRPGRSRPRVSPAASARRRRPGVSRRR